MRDYTKENERARERYKLNSEIKKAKVRLYKENNSDSIRANNKAYRKKRKQDPLYKFTENIRKLIVRSFKKTGLIKSGKTNEILGCSLIEFKEHIEKQFEPWMTWDNRGSSTQPKTKWQIDHIIPLATAKNKEDIIRLNHYKNLRPLCAKENRDKGIKLI